MKKMILGVWSLILLASMRISPSPSGTLSVSDAWMHSIFSHENNALTKVAQDPFIFRVCSLTSCFTCIGDLLFFKKFPWGGVVLGVTALAQCAYTTHNIVKSYKDQRQQQRVSLLERYWRAAKFTAQHFISPIISPIRVLRTCSFCEKKMTDYWHNCSQHQMLQTLLASNFQLKSEIREQLDYEAREQEKIKSLINKLVGII